VYCELIKQNVRQDVRHVTSTPELETQRGGNHHEQQLLEGSKYRRLQDVGMIEAETIGGVGVRHG
jgi:hypothetical protein